MKKLAIFACIMFVGVSVATASTVSIPFYADAGTPGTAYIGFQNVSGGDQVVSFRYFTNDEGVPVASQYSTILLIDKESASFRPYAPSDGTNSANVIAATTAGYVSAAPAAFGSAEIVSGGTITGRYVQYGDGSAWTNPFAHLTETVE